MKTAMLQYTYLRLTHGFPASFFTTDRYSPDIDGHIDKRDQFMTKFTLLVVKNR